MKTGLENYYIACVQFYLNSLGPFERCELAKVILSIMHNLDLSNCCSILAVGGLYLEEFPSSWAHLCCVYTILRPISPLLCVSQVFARMFKHSTYTDMYKHKKIANVPLVLHWVMCVISISLNVQKQWPNQVLHPKP